MEEHLITVKESKLSQEMSKMHEQLEKNKGVALKASSKEKKSSSSTSRIMVEEDSDEDNDMNMTPEQMALFVRKFNKMFKKSGFFNKNEDKDKIKTKRTSNRPCFGCGNVGVLDRQTYQGGSRGSRFCGGDHDRETENSKVCAWTRDTRFIQVRAGKVANPTSCLGIKYGALRLVLVEIRCPARYPVLLYIVQGAGS
jgi:hypothetical protein